MDYRDPYILLRVRPAPEIGAWRVTKPIQTAATYEAEFSLRADGALLRRIRNDGDLWSPYEQFTAAGWTIDTTTEFLTRTYANVTLT